MARMTLAAWIFMPGILVLAPFAAGCQREAVEVVAEEQAEDEAEEVSGEAPPRYELRSSPVDAEVAAELRLLLDQGIETVEAYFESPFREPFTVELLEDRPAFDDSFPPEWGMSQTACWMVATGVADALRILSPRVWSTEACEHDPDDAAHVRGIVVHELTHVFHGQHNPTGDFVGAEEVGWFGEGLAVVVSGQLAEKRADALAAVESGQTPARLAEAWSGQYRYGVSGSMVAFIETLVGREGLLAALAFTQEAQLLELVELSEEDFLGAWSEYVRDTSR